MEVVECEWDCRCAPSPTYTAWTLQTHLSQDFEDDLGLGAHTVDQKLLLSMIVLFVDVGRS